jgi:phosphotransferase system HPr-like phosphotransfer protein
MSETSEALVREFTVQNRMGIHTRPAAQIVRLANRYPDVEITVSKDDEVVNGKSIMGLMHPRSSTKWMLCLPVSSTNPNPPHVSPVCQPCRIRRR